MKEKNNNICKHEYSPFFISGGLAHSDSVTYDSNYSSSMMAGNWNERFYLTCDLCKEKHTFSLWKSVMEHLKTSCKEGEFEKWQQERKATEYISVWAR